MAEGIPQHGVVHSSFRSTDIAAMEAFSAQHYSTMAMRPSPDGRRLEIGSEGVAVPGLSTSVVWVSAGVDARIGTIRDKYIVDLMHDGRMTWDTDAYGTVEFGPGDAAMMPTTGGFHDLAENIDLDSTALDIAMVTEFAEQVHGISAERVQVTGLTPISADAARQWSRTVADVRDRVLGNPLLLENPIAVDSAFRRTASAFLTTFPNTVLDGAFRRDRFPRGPLPARTVRVVGEYLRAHADRPVGPADLNRITGRPARDALVGLRRAGLDAAKMLWECRLTGAHRDLLDTDPEVGAKAVPGIAARWGFLTPGGFRVAYTRAFGETPEETATR